MNPSEPTANACEHEALAQACRALWLATLSLMTAFMHESARAQRVLLARRIAHNFAMLERESEAFAPQCRESFARLARRWSQTSVRLSAEPALAGRPLRRAPVLLGRHSL